MTITAKDLEPTLKALGFCKLHSQEDDLETGEAVNTLAALEALVHQKAKTDPELADMVAKYMPDGPAFVRFDKAAQGGADA